MNFIDRIYSFSCESFLICDWQNGTRQHYVTLPASTASYGERTQTCTCENHGNLCAYLTNWPLTAAVHSREWLSKRYKTPRQPFSKLCLSILQCPIYKHYQSSSNQEDSFQVISLLLAVQSHDFSVCPLYSMFYLVNPHSNHSHWAQAGGSGTLAHNFRVTCLPTFCTQLTNMEYLTITLQKQMLSKLNHTPICHLWEWGIYSLMVGAFIT